MVFSRYKPQPSAAIPWQEFLDWLVCGVVAIQPLTYKKIGRVGRGWRQDAKRRIQRQVGHLVKNNEVHLPLPYLQRARELRNQLLLTAYLVAPALHKRPDQHLAQKVRLDEGTVRKRIYEVRKKLVKGGIDPADVVELQYATFRSYDLGPYGKKITKNLPPLSYPHFWPKKALSEWERTKIAELCARRFNRSLRPRQARARRQSST